ncbi:uncharacterized protein [Scyliorhinus torazame]
MLGMALHTEGNSTVDNYCADSLILPAEQLQKKRRSLISVMLWIVVPLFLLCIIAIVRSSLCRIPNKQGIGMLVKLKFICICGIKSDLYKGRDNDPGISAMTVPEIGEPCADGNSSEPKHLAVMMPLINNKKTETPTLENKSEILDSGTVAVVVHSKDNAEDNIPFPVQENGRYSNTYYPIEEQSQKQYSQSIMIETKDMTQSSL